ncbi:MAG: hypothetical protein PHO91_04285 [Patescibacteria group bacterium]|nr:hypothetical protein [Patescibacteria group bacterium]
MISWSIIRKLLKSTTTAILVMTLLFSGFPSNSFFDYLDKASKENNIVDLFYLALKDGNVIDKNIFDLLKPKIETAKAADFKIQTGYYIGNANAKSISGLGFTPELVLLKPNSNAGIGAIWQSKVMPKTTNPLFIATADTTGALVLDEDGFTVAGANANTVNIGHAWVAMAGSDCSASGTFCIGHYAGDGTASRLISTGFDPAMVWVKRSTAVSGSWRSTAMGANVGQYFVGAQDTTGTLFQGIGADSGGFTVGATNNASGGIYYYVAFAGANVAVGSYTGNGSTNAVSGLSFAPDFVFAKNSANTGSAMFTISEGYGNLSWYYSDTAALYTAFTGLSSDGFTVGTAAEVNGSTNLHYYAAFGGASDSRSSSGTFEMAQGSYVGNGALRTISGLDFAPDLVIIKRNAATAGVFRTSDMGGDSSAYLDAATANLAGAITALLHNGFNIGISDRVNSSGETYYWTAYGNAWKAETNSGASDFFIGSYFGTGQNNRIIDRLPFTPDLLVVKRSGATGGVFRTSGHSGDSSSLFTAGADAAGHIKAISSSSFQIGTTANVNTSGSYYWYFGFKAGSNLVVGSYDGNGTGQDVTTGSFEPDYIWVKRQGASQAVQRNFSMAANSALPFIAAGNVNNAITAIGSNYFTVATANETNNGSSSYWYVAWNANSSQESSSPSYKIQTGYYIGNANAKSISGLGFTPELVLLKPNSNAGIGAIWQSKVMPKTTNPLFIATADTTGALVLDEDGFTVAGANANTVNIGHAWVAMAGSDCSASGTFCIGHYAGDGTASRLISTGFDPAMVWVKRSTAVSGSWRSTAMGANVGQYFVGAQDTTGTLFQGIGADSGGFTVGATNNASGGIYYYVAFAGANVAVGSYTGNGSTNAVSGLSFAPDFVFAKNSANTGSAMFTISEGYGNLSWYYSDTAALYTAFTGLSSDGFTVGTAAEVNGSTNLHYYAAFGGASDSRSSSGTFEMAQGSYVGNGALRTISGLDFAPDLVIIKRNAATAGVFRTSDMGGDSSAYLDAATANLAGAITALLHNGFNIGISDRVNSSGETYYWTAYGNAWKAETNSGASDFFIGSYFGTGQNNRIIDRLPFTPDLLVVKRSGATGGVFRTSGHSGDSSSLFTAGADAAGHIKAISSSSFQIGTTANVNTSGSYYWYFGFKAGSNLVVGSYDGNGTGQDVTTGSFEPDYIWVKRQGASQAVQRNFSMAANSALPFIAAGNVNNAITAIGSNYFTVATANETNNGSSSYWYVAWNIPGGATIVSISITTDGAVSFGTLNLESVQDNTPGGVNDVEVLSIDSGPADLYIKSTNFSQGENIWALSTSNGPSQVKWEFATSTSHWVDFAQSNTNYLMDTSVSTSATRNIYLRLTMPTATDTFGQYSATVTITATAP